MFQSVNTRCLDATATCFSVCFIIFHKIHVTYWHYSLSSLHSINPCMSHLVLFKIFFSPCQTVGSRNPPLMCVSNFPFFFSFTNYGMFQWITNGCFTLLFLHVPPYLTYLFHHISLLYCIIMHIHRWPLFDVSVQWLWLFHDILSIYFSGLYMFVASVPLLFCSTLPPCSSLFHTTVFTCSSMSQVLISPHL